MTKRARRWDPHAQPIRLAAAAPERPKLQPTDSDKPPQPRASLVRQRFQLRSERFAAPGDREGLGCFLPLLARLLEALERPGNTGLPKRLAQMLRVRGASSRECIRAGGVVIGRSPP